jgi:GTP-binding protein EngB required for normal cell division
LDAISNYKNLEFKLYDRASQIKDIYAGKGLLSEYGAELDATLNRIRSRRFRVAVMGEFKRGKSTFINALLGARVLPADVTPTTAVVNRITYGDTARVVIRGKDGSEYEIEMGELSDYVTKLTKEGEERAALIREAVVAYPTVLCQNHADILDTPGLNDDPVMTAVSEEAAASVDAVILVLSALSPFSELEARFAAQLISLGNIENIFFVVSFIDQIDESERDEFLSRLKTRIQSSLRDEMSVRGASVSVAAKAEKILSSLKLLGVSSIFALEAFVSGDAKKLKASRIETLKGELYQFLTSTQGASVIQKSREDILRHCENLRRLNRDAAGEIARRAEWFASSSSRLEEYAARGAGIFANRLSQLSSVAADIAAAINREKNAAAKEIMSVISFPDVTAAQLATAAASTASRINGEFADAIKETARDAFAARLLEAREAERAIIHEACDILHAEGGPGLSPAAPFTDEFDVTLLSGAPGFAWSARDAAAIAEAPASGRALAALQCIDEIFSAYAGSWNEYIGAIQKEISAHSEIEAAYLIPRTIEAVREANITSAAHSAFERASLEKEGRKIEEISSACEAEIPGSAFVDPSGG